MGPPDGLSRAVDALRALHGSSGRPLEVLRAHRARRHAVTGPLSVDARSHVRDLRAMVRADAGAFSRAISERSGRQRRRLSRGDSRKSARHAPRPAAGRRAVEHGVVRHRSGVRGPAAPHARESRGRVSRVRRSDTHRAAKSDSGVSHARRSTRSRRAVDAILLRDEDRDREHRRAASSPAKSASRGPR